MKNRALHNQLMRHVLKLQANAKAKAPVTLVWSDGGQLVDMHGNAFAGPPGSPSGAHRILEYQRFESQQAFHDLPTRFKGFSGSIGSGKSKALVHEAIRSAYRNPGVPGLIGAPTYRLLKDATQIELLMTLEDLRIPFVHRKADSSVYLKEPDVTILLRSLDGYECGRAMNLGWFGVDELTYCKEQAWTRLEGRLRHPKARYKCAFAAWTPRGKDWVYRRFISSRKIDSYGAVRAQPFENRAILDATPDFYENLKQSYDDKFYRQEILGEYLDMYSGAVYRSFSDRNVRTCSFDPALPLIVALDFNVNPMSGLLLQCETVYRRDTVRVIQEIILPGSHIAEWCEEFLRRTREWAESKRQSGGKLHVCFYGDANGGARQASSGGDSTWTILERRMGAAEHYRARYLYKRSNPEVIDRVNAVNSMLCAFGDKQTATGDRRLYIDPACRELITDLEEVVWKVDAHGITYPEIDKRRDAKRTHASDALGYYIEAAHSVSFRGGAIRDTL